MDSSVSSRAEAGTGLSVGPRSSEEPSPGSAGAAPPFPEEAPWTTRADEIALLFACTRATAPDGPEIREYVGPDLDWTFVLEQAARHGVDPMLHRSLSGLDDGAVPTAVRDALRARGEGVLAYNLHRLRVLLEVVEVLESEAIPALSVKGPVLADRYYENVGLRRFADLDLLVPRPALRRADALLRDRGFEPADERADGELTQRIEDQVGVDLVRPEDGVRVELHWAFLNESFAFPLDPEAARARAEQHHVGGQSVRVLSDEDLLLYLCAHGTKHHWARLKWVCDVAEVCRGASGVDWERLGDRAGRLDVDRVLLLGLRLARRWLGAPVPEGLRDRLHGEPALSALVRQVEAAWLFTKEGLDRTPRWDQLAFFLRTRRRWRNRWPLLREYGGLALTPTGKDRAVLDLPPSASFLYYVIRPLRLLGLVRPGTGAG